MIFALSLLLDCRDQDDSDRKITRDHSKSWVSSFLSMQVASISDNSPIPWIAAIFVLSRRLPKFPGPQNSPKITQTSLMSTSHPILTDSKAWGISFGPGFSRNFQRPRQVLWRPMAGIHQRVPKIHTAQGALRDGCQSVSQVVTCQAAKPSEALGWWFI